MPFEQQPSPVVPPLSEARPWGVPLAGGAGAAALAAFAFLDPSFATQAWAAAAAVGAVTLLLTLQAFRRPRARAATAALVSADPGDPDPSYEAALEALADPVLIVRAGDPDDVAGRRVIFANAAAREFLRIPREGALLVTALRDPTVLEIVDEALFGGIEGVTGFETRGAQDRIWRAWTRPLPALKVRERLALVYLRDETDARRMEQMRADFLANASHELRTPLASLAGFIETLKGHAKDDPVARDRFLEIMTAQAERMSRLIVDLLSLSRIELNEHIPPSGEADLSLIVRDVVDALAPLAAHKDVRLEPKVPDVGLALICGDRDQIVQVVQNLVDNAIKYSPGGQAVEIEVSTNLTGAEATAPASPLAARLSLLTPDRSDAARYVLLRVRDHGPGVARQHLPRLTERFYRVEGQKSGQHLGTGLGLAIVKHIANRHRGGLWVESVEGEGAAFCAYFPSGPSEPRATRHQRTQTLAAPAPAADRNKTVTETS